MSITCENIKYYQPEGIRDLLGCDGKPHSDKFLREGIEELARHENYEMCAFYKKELDDRKRPSENVLAGIFRCIRFAKERNCIFPCYILLSANDYLSLESELLQEGFDPKVDYAEIEKRFVKVNGIIVKANSNVINSWLNYGDYFYFKLNYETRK